MNFSISKRYSIAEEIYSPQRGMFPKMKKLILQRKPSDRYTTTGFQLARKRNNRDV